MTHPKNLIDEIRNILFVMARVCTSVFLNSKTKSNDTSKNLIDEINKRNIDKKIAEIERHVSNGNTLAYPHIYVIDRVKDGHATQYDLAMLNQAYKQIKEGTYQKLKNYHFGVEHITKDPEHYIYYKDDYLDHFTYGSDWLSEWKDTLAAARICKLLEQKGHPISLATYGWNVEKYLTPEEIGACNDVEDEIIKQLRA